MNAARMIHRADAMCDGAAIVLFFSGHQHAGILTWCAGVLLYWIAEVV